MIAHGKRARTCWALVATLFAWVVAGKAAIAAERAVKIGEAYALLEVPGSPKGSIVLIPGGDGNLGIKPDGSFDSLRGNQLVRTRSAYALRGLAVLTVDRGVEVGAAIAYMAKIARPVVLVATSRGSLKVPAALASNPDAVVLTASFLNEVRSMVGNAGKLPPTLIVHHRNDGCRHTPPSGVEPFARWGGAKVTVRWFEGGTDSGDPCQARGHHGFNGLDSAVVEAISAYTVAQR